MKPAKEFSAVDLAAGNYLANSESNREPALRAAVERALAYGSARATRDALERDADAASKAWNAIPGAGSGRMGLTPDAVKASPQWRDASAHYQAAAERLKAFNRTFCRIYAAELRAERDARRATLAKGN